MFRDAPGVYVIQNVINNKKYIGSSISIKRRMSEHFRCLKKQRHPSLYFQRAFNKYNEDNFKPKCLLYCDKSNLLFYEQRALDVYKPYNSNYGYNTCSKAGNMLGFKFSEESKKKSSISHLGIKSGMKGRKHTEESKLKMSNSSATKGKRPSEKTIQAVIAARRGVKHTEETKLKISLAHKGKKKKPL